MRHIPARLLRSTMTWRAPSDGADGLGGEYGEAHVTERVGMYRRSRASASGGAETTYEVADQEGATVFVDAALSVGDVPPVGALVSVDGGPEMVVWQVKPEWCPEGLHHTEIGLR